MIQIVMKPEKAPVVKGESLYRALLNGEHIGLLVRARNAREAERKMMIVFRHELSYKTIDFNAENYSVYERKENGKETDDRGDPEEKGAAAKGRQAPEGGEADDPAAARGEA